MINRGWELGSESKYFVRFLTPKIKELIPRNEDPKNNWSKKESFLFEIQLDPKSNRIIFKTCISPSDDKYNMEKLQDILVEIEELERRTKGNWLVNYQEKKEFPFFNNYESFSDEDLRKSINDFYDKISEIVSKVENKLVEHSEELMRMKSV